MELAQRAGPSLAIDRMDAEPDLGDIGGTDVPRRRTSGHHRRWVVVALALSSLALLVATFGYLTGNEIQANTEFDQTHRSLDVTEQHLDSVLTDLSTVDRELHTVKEQATADSAALAQDTSELQEVKKALTNAQANVTHQTSTIGDLNTCLSGVEQALNALAVADQNAAIGALNSVTTSCANAVASNG